MSRRDIQRLLPRHILDSLTSHPLLGSGRVLDLGSGAGFPGVPLAIANPQLQFVLCDRSERRARFLTHVSQALGLANVEVWAQALTSDDADTERSFDTLIARAVMPTVDVVVLARSFVVDGGRALIFESTHALDDQNEEGVGEVNANQPHRRDFIDEAYTRHQVTVPGLPTTHTLLEVTL